MLTPMPCHAAAAAPDADMPCHAAAAAAADADACCCCLLRHMNCHACYARAPRHVYHNVRYYSYATARDDASSYLRHTATSPHCRFIP